MGSLRSLAQAHDLRHLATESLPANRNQSFRHSADEEHRAAAVGAAILAKETHAAAVAPTSWAGGCGPGRDQCPDSWPEPGSRVASPDQVPAGADPADHRPVSRDLWTSGGALALPAGRRGSASAHEREHSSQRCGTDDYRPGATRRPDQGGVRL